MFIGQKKIGVLNKANLPLPFLHSTFNFLNLSPAVKRIQAHLPCVFEKTGVSVL